jgi:hypothetical protein
MRYWPMVLDLLKRIVGQLLRSSLLQFFSIMQAQTTTASTGARTCVTPAVPTVKLAVTRFGDFGDALSVGATVDGIEPGRNGCDTVAVSYRGQVKAWVNFPLGADRDAVIAAVQHRADWLLGGRCPDMEAYPLAFS